MNWSQVRRMIAAGLIGNVLEWYDFAIYGYFATAIGRHFFPHEDAVAQLLSAFGVFALGYLMRPVGGEIAVDRKIVPFEHVADQAGGDYPAYLRRIHLAFPESCRSLGATVSFDRCL